MPVSTRDLADMQSTASAELTDTATISRNTVVNNGQGGHTATSATVDTVDCLLAPLKRQDAEQLVGDRGAGVVRRVLTTPASTDIRLTDRVVCQGSTWEVTQLLEPRSLEIVRRVEIVRVS